MNGLHKYGAPGEIRTPDRPVRSRVLYPAELRARCVSSRNTDASRGVRIIRARLLIVNSWRRSFHIIPRCRYNHSLNENRF